MNTITVQQSGQLEKHFVPIHLETLEVDSIFQFDLFIRRDNKLTLFRSKDVPFSQAEFNTLKKYKLNVLYIKASDHDKYQDYLEQNLPGLIGDEKVPGQKKAEVIYEASKVLIKKVLADPTRAEYIKRSKDIVQNIVEYILKGRDAFLNLMQITSFNYYTYTHCVNVCTFSIALARRMRILNRMELGELGLGALLHDVGKVKVPKEIIEKQGKLNEEEFRLIKKHPEYGEEILKQTKVLTRNSFYPVIQHHERLDGSGYPHDLRESQIHQYSKIVAIADVFDALTTDRCYKKAIDTYPALKALHESPQKFDKKMLTEFTLLMGPEFYQK